MIVAGIGFRAAATAEALAAALAALGPDAPMPEALATAAEKADAAALRVLAARMGLPVVSVPASRLSGVKTPTRSERVKERFGTGSLAEAAALAAAGPGARIIAGRVTSPCGMATAALAEGDGREGDGA
ncbi:precorrin methylase [Aliigemmobacter aestuarii]|uniref:Precorrin methylase n=1 Tax=Aliigemmobacter aestuarii TaxID=1445661 RepID=A0A4S3MRN1_9RHOB|nr:cobalamin biosynthesis protein [Gemmobacter aestuarii]THD84733.1 precorrin methylase [Gemmobacter aestuarii]